MTISFLRFIILAIVTRSISTQVSGALALADVSG